MGIALSDLSITSSFANLADIPLRHTGDGDNEHPPISWRNLPDGTESIAVVCVDPDAPFVSDDGQIGFVHWIVYNVRPDEPDLQHALSSGRCTVGRNSLGACDYLGPRPPAGHGVHHYYFWLFALSRAVDVPDDLALPQLLAEIEPALVGMNRLVGCYEAER